MYPSTFSIVAYDFTEPAWGVAVASKFLAVGNIVPWARAGAGAIATQAYANTSYGPTGLDLMEKGFSAEETLKVLLDTDPQPEKRQIGLVKARGDTATFTGELCHEWAGGLAGEDFAVQGNILAVQQVVHAMAETFIKRSGNLAWRLYHALHSGDQAGGDRRGRQSAAILVVKPQGGYGGYNDRWIDYRVDDHPDPVKRLADLLELHDLYFGESPIQDQVTLSGDTLRQLQELMARLGYYRGPINEEYDNTTRTALEAFIGNENFEERTDFEAGRIDRPVLDYILSHYLEAAE